LVERTFTDRCQPPRAQQRAGSVLEPIAVRLAALGALGLSQLAISHQAPSFA